MPQGDKSKYTSKQRRQAQHIEDSYKARGERRDCISAHILRYRRLAACWAHIYSHCRCQVAGIALVLLCDTSAAPVRVVCAVHCGCDCNREQVEQRRSRSIACLTTRAICNLLYLASGPVAPRQQLLG